MTRRDDLLDPKLNTLLKVYETGSYTRAADALMLTQPAVSQHVKQLESALDVKIFIRKDGELLATREGEIVLKYARRIKSLYANMQQSIINERRQLKRIRIGITHTAESNQIAEVLAKYCSSKEGVTITITSDSVMNLYSKLSDFELDLAIVEGGAVPSGMNSLLLDTDYLVLAVSNNNPLAKKPLVTIDDLKKEKMILRLPNSGTRNLFAAQLESRGMSLDEFNIILEVDNIATIKDLIRRDFGVSILARSACMDELRKGKITVLPIENLSMVREINVVYRGDFEHIDILREIARTYTETMKLYSI